MAEALDEVLRLLLQQASQLWPDSPPQDIQAVAHFVRPYSTVHRLQLGGNTSAPTSPSGRFAYVKILRTSGRRSPDLQKYLNRLKGEFEVAGRLQRQLAASHRVAVVRPIAFFPEQRALVTEEAPGKTIAHWIEAACKRWHSEAKLLEVESHCRNAGEALALLQRACPAEELFEAAELTDYVRVRLDRLVENDQAPFRSSDAEAVLEFLQRPLSHLTPAELQQCGCHCDFAPFNLMADASRVTMLDFSMFKTGSIYNDITYFYQRLESYLHKPIYSEPAIRRLQRAFLEAYNAHAGRKEAIETGALFKVFCLKHVVNNYSAIARGRVVQGREVPLPVRTFNRHVFRRYNNWLRQTCN